MDSGTKEPKSLTEGVRRSLVELVNKNGYPYSVARRGNKLYLYLSLGPFFSFSEADVFEDLSKFEYYERYHEDAQIAGNVVEALKAFD